MGQTQGTHRPLLTVGDTHRNGWFTIRGGPFQSPWPGYVLSLEASSDLTNWTQVATLLHAPFEFVHAQGLLATQASDVSLLHALFYVHAGGDLDTLRSVDEGAQRDRIVGGAGTVAQALAHQLGDRVLLGAPVRRVVHGDSGVVVHADGDVEVAASRPGP
jgi:monoamine oxidase